MITKFSHFKKVILHIHQTYWQRITANEQNSISSILNSVLLLHYEQKTTRIKQNSTTHIHVMEGKKKEQFIQRNLKKRTSYVKGNDYAYLKKPGSYKLKEEGNERTKKKKIRRKKEGVFQSRN